MKIGILTFHSAHNYGAVLQAYATKEYLKSLGHEVNIIDYRPNYIKDVYKVKFAWNSRITKLPFDFIRQLILKYPKEKRFKKFELFIEEKLEPLNSNSGIPTHLNGYIIGSDQVWNPEITQEFDPVFFANFGFEKQNKVYISYAASMETTSLNKAEADFFSHNLNRFDSISVREYELLSLLQPLSKKEIVKVLDPTFLLDSSKWINTAKNIDKNSKYVLVYQVRQDSRTLKIANQIAKQLGAVVIQLVSQVSVSNYIDSNVAHDASPEEFIGYIKNAACVVTTSFHGTAFAVIFQKDFYYVALNDGKNTRTSSLLNSINLQDRMIKVESDPIFEEVDYSNSYKPLNEQIAESSTFLIKALSKCS